MHTKLLRALLITFVAAPCALSAVVEPVEPVEPVTRINISGIVDPTLTTSTTTPVRVIDTVILAPVTKVTNPTIIASPVSQTPVKTTTTTSTTPKQTPTTSIPKSTTTSTSITTIIQQPTSTVIPKSTTILQNSTITTPPVSTTTSVDVLNGTRTTDILATITGIYSLPNQTQVVQNATLNSTDIQGDILIGMKKKEELFLFFEIEDVPTFKKYFHTYVVPRITTTFQLLSVATQPIVALNVAFAQRGLYKLGINDNVFDKPYTAGQQADANNLGDPGTQNWVPPFTSGKIDGVFLIASDNITYINTFKAWLLTTLTPAGITDIYELQGNIRPGAEAGHEMFGYLDGIGQPAVAGFNINPVPGQQIINAGVILTGQVGDTLQSVRPAWMFDGSFLVFRQLQQLVPEFDQFLYDSAPAFPGYTQDQNADLLGARLIGRWKSGTPVDLSPTFDSGLLSPLTNNNFDYSHTGFSLASDESHCPFGAHIRKTRPRADENTPLDAIMRAGIPYGPEVTAAERATNTSDPTLERGLAFVAYQSQIAAGFQFIQTQWANQVNFAPGKSQQPGFDMIFGQNHAGPKWISGTDINNPPWILNGWTDWVVSRGGEYFFSPSIQALATVFST